MLGTRLARKKFTREKYCKKTKCAELVSREKNSREKNIAKKQNAISGFPDAEIRKFKIRNHARAGGQVIKWADANMEICKSVNLEIWKSGNLEI